MGNQISVKPVGYTKVAANFTDEEAESFDEQVLLHVEIDNHGLSDQIHKDFKLKISNMEM